MRSFLQGQENFDKAWHNLMGFPCLKSYYFTVSLNFLEKNTSYSDTPFY